MRKDLKFIDHSAFLPVKFYCEDVPAGELIDGPLYMEAEFGPGLSLDPHLHPSQIESYEVLSGTLDVCVDRQWRPIHTGDSLDIPEGTVHAIRNSSGGVVRVVNTLRPGLRTRDFLQSVERLIHERKLTSTRDLKSIVYFSVLAAQFRDVFISSRPPDVVIRNVARIGRLLGCQV
jgi:hypothetical protein